MADIWCLGSINIDMFYDVPHIPAPGETLAATGHSIGLGGKGANQSAAAAKAGAKTFHIGAIGENSSWVVDRLDSYGVETTWIAKSEEPTGQALINVALDGENAIVLLAGANASLDLDHVKAAISKARSGDILLMQNETTLQAETAELAKEKGVRVFYSAAPFDDAAVRSVLPFIDTLFVNEIEAAQLEKSLNQSLKSLEVPHIVITLGADGARWIDTSRDLQIDVSGLRVKAVDTTGAGDTFAGYFAAGCARGDTPKAAMELATKAAALKVTKKGTADAIPFLEEVVRFTP